ncbi:MAG: hypothetical protein C0609_11730 [Deltaproteobacteria bacterium]|nr:MAG: hypothetical protein C0609_11730 [Deltaproteobacteria bacterium]
MKFFFAVMVSLAVHLVLIMAVMPSSALKTMEAGRSTESEIAKRYADGINRVLPMDTGTTASLEGVLARIDGEDWTRQSFPDTFLAAAKEAGLPAKEVELVPALDSDRSKQGRLDIIVKTEWPEERDVSDLLIYGFLAGEGTLKSNFSSHRLWVYLDAGDEGSGRAAFETMDCRYFRNGKTSPSGFLYNSTWSE